MRVYKVFKYPTPFETVDNITKSEHLIIVVSDIVCQLQVLNTEIGQEFSGMKDTELTFSVTWPKLAEGRRPKLFKKGLIYRYLSRHVEKGALLSPSSAWQQYDMLEIHKLLH